MKFGYKKAVLCVSMLMSFLLLTAFAGIAGNTSPGFTVVQLPENTSAENVSAEELQPVGFVTVAEDLKKELDSQIIKEQQEDTKRATIEVSQKIIVEKKQAEAAAEAAEWEKVALANVEDSLSIRAEASEEAELLGRLYKGCAGEVLEYGEEWSKISSGSVVGYVKNDYVYFGTEAKEKADQEGNRMAIVNTDTLRVRREASEEAPVAGLAGMGDELTVLGESADWVQVQFDEEEAFISKQYVSVDYIFGEAISIEEEIAAKKAAEERALKEKAQKQVKAVQDAPSPLSADEVTLLAGMIQCEAGNQSMEGMIAVGNVIMNRVRSGGYPNSVYGVITARGQFPPATNGTLSNVLARGVKSSCYSAAQAVMRGTNYVGGATHFRSVSSGYQGIIIGNHVFW